MKGFGFKRNIFWRNHVTLCVRGLDSERGELRGSGGRGGRGPDTLLVPVTRSHLHLAPVRPIRSLSMTSQVTDPFHTA